MTIRPLGDSLIISDIGRRRLAGCVGTCNQGRLPCRHPDVCSCGARSFDAASRQSAERVCRSLAREAAAIFTKTWSWICKAACGH